MTLIAVGKGNEIHEAVESGRLFNILNQAKNLTEKLCEKNSDGLTPLMLAATNGNPEVRK